MEAKVTSLGSNGLIFVASVEDKNDGTYIASFSPQETLEHSLSAIVCQSRGVHFICT